MLLGAIIKLLSDPVRSHVVGLCVSPRRMRAYRFCDAHALNCSGVTAGSSPVPDLTTVSKYSAKSPTYKQANMSH